MGNLNNENITFCENCPFADGIEEADSLQVKTNGWAPSPGIEFTFVDAEGNKSHSVHSTPTRSFDSTMVPLTGREIIDRVKSCNHANERTVKRLGGLLGEKTVYDCNAFKGQDPKAPVVKTLSDAWKYIEY